MFCSFVSDTDLTKLLEVNLASPEGCTQELSAGNKQRQSQSRRHAPQRGHRISAYSPAGDQPQSQILAYGDRPRAVQLAIAWGTS